MKKILLIVAVVVLVVIGSFLVYYFYFFEAGKQAAVDKENFAIAQLIQEEIGGFNIKKAYDYQGGVIMNVYRQNADMIEDFAFFYKDGKLQKLPEEYILETIKNQLSEEEKTYKTASFKQQEEYNVGVKDENGNDVIYRNVFVMANELPRSIVAANPIFPGYSNKYQIIIADKFGQIREKFMLSQLP